MNEPTKTTCKHCGGWLMRWDDIAAAMENAIESAPIGYKAMFRQAVDEIRELRKISMRSGIWARPDDFPTIKTWLGEEIEGLHRDAMRYRCLRARGDVFASVCFSHNGSQCTAGPIAHEYADSYADHAVRTTAPKISISNQEVP